ncbi:MAG: NfeD family protein [Firmicutes bacterium]|nr:NfeD family protein [Bacillota bacterium]
MIAILAALTTNAYFYIAIAFTTFFVLQGVFSLFGIGDNFEIDSDFDGDLDTHFDLSDGVSMTLHLFSIRGIIAFFVMFGWTGYFLTNSDMNGFLVFIISFIAGGIMLFLVSLIYFLMGKLSQNGTIDIRNAIGKTGSVYNAIPERNQGTGKVQIIVGETLHTLDAISKDKSIKTGQQVKVVGINNYMLEVEEID